MKSTKQFNNISDELKKLIPKLKQDEVVVFQMLNGVPNPEPDDKERAKQGEMLYPKVQVMTQFRIFDKFKEEYVDIVLADGWIGEVPSKARCFVPGNENGLQGSRFQGKFQCAAGVVRDEELFEVLFLSPQRKETPCPDPSVEQIFEMVDVKAGTSERLGKFDQLKKVIAIMEKIKPSDARRVMRALNQPEYQDDDTLLAMTKDFATKNVDTFLKTYSNKDTHTMSELKDAIAAKVLEHDFATGNVKLLGTVVTTLKVSSPEQFPEAMVRWINTAENGKDVWNNIKSQMEKSETK